MAKYSQRTTMIDEDDTAIEIKDPFARRLLAQYLERREQDFNALGAALANSDFAAIEQIGHRLGGSGSAYGLDEVTRLGGQLERAASQENYSAVADSIEQLESFVRRLKLS